MADNIQGRDFDGNPVPLATDDIAGVHYPRTKIGFGADDAYADVSSSNRLPVDVAFPATQPVSAAALPLPTGAATEATLAAIAADIGDVADAEATGNGTVIAILKRMRTLLDGASSAVLTSYTQAGVIAINTVLATLDCSRYRSVSIQCVSMGTAGVVTPEWSNDNTNWLAATMQTAAGATATTFNAAGLFVLPVMARFLRLRLSTATTAGTTTLSIHQFNDRTQMWLATQPVSGTVTAAVTAGTVNPVVPATPYILNSAASTNEALILTGTSGLQAFYATNTGATVVFVKLYNKATAPISTDIPAMILVVPAAVSGVPGVCTLPIGFSGFRFALGLGIRITGGVADNDTTAVAAGQVKVMLSRTV